MAPTDTIKFDKWAHEFTSMLVNETFKLIASQKTSGKSSDKIVKYLMSAYLARFIGAWAYDTLNSEKGSKEAKQIIYKKTAENFAEVKSRIQESVAAGLSGAMNTFTGKEVEYFCNIVIVPPADSKNNKVC